MRVSTEAEGPLDALVAYRLLGLAGHVAEPVHVKRGKAGVLRKQAEYNAAAQHGPRFVLVDVDQDFACAPML